MPTCLLYQSRTVRSTDGRQCSEMALSESRVWAQYRHKNIEELQWLHKNFKLSSLRIVIKLQHECCQLQELPILIEFADIKIQTLLHERTPTSGQSSRTTGRDVEQDGITVNDIMTLKNGNTLASQHESQNERNFKEFSHKPGRNANPLLLEGVLTTVDPVTKHKNNTHMTIQIKELHWTKVHETCFTSIYSWNNNKPVHSTPSSPMCTHCLFINIFQ